MNYFRIILLFPVSVLVFLYTFIRNKCYDFGLFKSFKFGIHVIGVGNLSTGGTGKTPVVEYLTDLLLRNHFKVAVLSRGYKRKTKGYVLATIDSVATEIGDEPFQIKTKFREAIVAVCEKRVNGINQLLKNIPDLNVIILDDAFQHRSVTPGLNILLSDYHKPFYNDWVLPSGNLREAASNKKRANMIVVTKSPGEISEKQLSQIKSRIDKRNTQSLFFTHIVYEKLKAYNSNMENSFSETNSMAYSALLFAGISNITPLKNYITPKFGELFCMKFADHHYFTYQDLGNIDKQFNDIANPNKILITTEKDIARIDKTEMEEHFKKLPLYYVPIQVSFNNRANEDNNSFDTKILNYVRKDT